MSVDEMSVYYNDSNFLNEIKLEVMIRKDH